MKGAGTSAGSCNMQRPYTGAQDLEKLIDSNASELHRLGVMEGWCSVLWWWAEIRYFLT